MFTSLPGGGFSIDGQVTLTTPWMNFPLPEVHLSVQPMEVDGPLDYEVIGTVRPDLTGLPGVGQYFASGPVASFGVAIREHVRELLETADSVLPLPENESLFNPGARLEPAYVYFRFETGVELDLPLAEALGIDPEALGEQLGFELPDLAATLVLDPTDPFFYFAMDELASSDEEDDSSSNGDDDSDDSETHLKYELNALAYSLRGGIPFEMDTTWGLPEGAGQLHGQILLDGAFTLYGVELEGELVAMSMPGELELAANGQASVGLESHGMGINLPLGAASLAISVEPFDVQIDFSGELDIEDIEVSVDGVLGSLLPEAIPLTIRGAARAAGYIHQNGLGFAEAAYTAEGQFTVEPPYGIALWSLGVDGEIRFDSSGYTMNGSMMGTLHPALQFDGEVAVEASFPFDDLLAWHIGAHGRLSLAGVDLGVAHVLVNAQGLFIDGVYNTPMSQIQLAGELTAAGPHMAGFATVNLGEQGVGQVLEAAARLVSDAQRELASIDEELAALIALIEVERALAQAGIDLAQSAVSAAQAVVASLQGSIDAQYAMIGLRQSEINSWWQWAYNQPWYNQAWGWSVYAAEAGWRNADIAVRSASIAALSVLRTAATAALGLDEQALLMAESALANFPIAADPRVVGLQLSREAALVALGLAEQALAALPPLPDNLSAELSFELDQNGLSGTASITLDGTLLVGGEVTIGEYVVLTTNLAGIGEVRVEL